MTEDNIKCAIAHFDKKVTDYQIYVDRQLQNQDKQIKSSEDYMINTLDSHNKRITDINNQVANVVTKTVSGATLEIKDNSPIEHDLDISLLAVSKLELINPSMFQNKECVTYGEDKIIINIPLGGAEYMGVFSHIFPSVKEGDVITVCCNGENSDGTPYSSTFSEMGIEFGYSTDAGYRFIECGSGSQDITVTKYMLNCRVQIRAYREPSIFTEISIKGNGYSDDADFTGAEITVTNGKTTRTAITDATGKVKIKSMDNMIITVDNPDYIINCKYGVDLESIIKKICNQLLIEI